MTFKIQNPIKSWIIFALANDSNNIIIINLELMNRNGYPMVYGVKFITNVFVEICENYFQVQSPTKIS